jgi:hypothetical protein
MKGVILWAEQAQARGVFEAIAEVLLKYRNNVMQLEGRSGRFLFLDATMLCC